MKVLFLTNVPSPYRVEFFNELGKLCDLTVIFESKTAKSRDESWIEDKVLNFKAIFMKGIKIGEAEALCFGIIKYLSKTKFDKIIVGMYSSPTGMLAIEYMRFMKIPFIISSDGGIRKDDNGIKHRMKEHFISTANTWLSTGDITTEYLCYYGARKENVKIYPFTSVREKEVLECPVSIETKQELRNKLNIKEDHVVLSVGQFIFRKGYDILLNSCKSLNHNIGIYIVGGSPTDEYLELQKRLGLSNVHFVNFMNKASLSEYYDAADLFVLPTREDIWGLVVNEALAHGLPVITTDRCIAGIEMIDNGVNGRIVPVDTDWGRVIEEYFVNSDTVSMQQNALAVAKKYTIENMARVHYKIFEEIGGTEK